MPAECHPVDGKGNPIKEFDFLPQEMKHDLRKIAATFNEATDRVAMMDIFSEYFVTGDNEALEKPTVKAKITTTPNVPVALAWEDDMSISDFWAAHPTTRAYEFLRLKQRTRDKLTIKHEKEWHRVYDHNDWDTYAANLIALMKEEESSTADIDRLADFIDVNLPSYTNEEPTFLRLKKLTEEQRNAAIRLLDIKLRSEITRKQYILEAIRSRNEMTVKDVECAEVLINQCDRDYFALSPKSRIKVKGSYFSQKLYFTPGRDPGAKERKIQDLQALYDKAMQLDATT